MNDIPNGRSLTVMHFPIWMFTLRTWKNCYAKNPLIKMILVFHYYFWLLLALRGHSN